MIFHAIIPREEAWNIARQAHIDRGVPEDVRAKYLSGEWDAAPDVQLLATGAELAFQEIERRR